MCQGLKESKQRSFPTNLQTHNSTTRPREGVQNRHEPRKMVSKPLYSEMSIENDLALPLNVRIDIIELIKTIFKESIKSLNSYAVFSLVSQKIA